MAVKFGCCHRHKYFTGHGNFGSVLGISTYPVIQFTVNNDTLDFNGNVNILLEYGKQVSIRYQRNNPADVRINTFKGMWVDVIIYSAGLFLVYMALLFTRALIPKFILISRKRRRDFKSTLPDYNAS